MESVIPEKQKVNLHFHGLIDIKDWDFEEYSKVAAQEWGKVCSSGSTVFLKWTFGATVEYQFKSITNISLQEGWTEIILLPLQ